MIAMFVAAQHLQFCKKSLSYVQAQDTRDKENLRSVKINCHLFDFFAFSKRGRAAKLIAVLNIGLARGQVAAANNNVREALFSLDFVLLRVPHLLALTKSKKLQSQRRRPHVNHGAGQHR